MEIALQQNDPPPRNYKKSPIDVRSEICTKGSVLQTH